MTETIAEKKETGDVCSHKLAFMLDNIFRRLLQNPKKITAEYINKGDTVIDMGCGPGFFSIDMAKLAGKEGSVIAVDLQEEMLAKVKKKAVRNGVSDRMEFYQSKSDTIGLDRKADFILAYYMVHETPDQKSFLMEMKGMLKDGGRILVVEPGMHVSQNLFEAMLRDAEEIGLKAVEFPKGKGGRSVLFSIDE